MELEIKTPKFKIPEFKGFVNPLTNEGMRALAIVLGVIVVIAGIVYTANFGKRTESTVLPAMTEKEDAIAPELVVPTEIPTIIPLIEEEKLLISTSPTENVLRPIVTPIPAAEKVTVTPVPQSERENF